MIKNSSNYKWKGNFLILIKGIYKKQKTKPNKNAIANIPDGKRLTASPQGWAKAKNVDQLNVGLLLLQSQRTWESAGTERQAGDGTEPPYSF